MTHRRVAPMTRCTAHRSNGDPCRAFAMHGGHVCVVHGGKAPQVRLAADERIRRLVDPSLNRIARAIADDANPAIALQAARDILDRAGYKATEKIQSDGRTVIEIEYVDRPNALDPRNGVAH